MRPSKDENVPLRSSEEENGAFSSSEDRNGTFSSWEERKACLSLQETARRRCPLWETPGNLEMQFRGGGTPPGLHSPGGPKGENHVILHVGGSPHPSPRGDSEGILGKLVNVSLLVAQRLPTRQTLPARHYEGGSCCFSSSCGTFPI